MKLFTTSQSIIILFCLFTIFCLGQIVFVVGFVLRSIKPELRQNLISVCRFQILLFFSKRYLKSTPLRLFVLLFLNNSTSFKSCIRNNWAVNLVSPRSDHRLKQCNHQQFDERGTTLIRFTKWIMTCWKRNIGLLNLEIPH